MDSVFKCIFLLRKFCLIYKTQLLFYMAFRCVGKFFSSSSWYWLALYKHPIGSEEWSTLICNVALRCLESLFFGPCVRGYQHGFPLLLKNLKLYPLTTLNFFPGQEIVNEYQVVDNFRHCLPKMLFTGNATSQHIQLVNHNITGNHK